MVTDTFTAGEAFRRNGVDPRADVRKARHQRSGDDAVLSDRSADHAAVPGSASAQPLPLPRGPLLLPAQPRTSAGRQGVRQARAFRTRRTEEWAHGGLS